MSQRYEEYASQALTSRPPPGPELHFSFWGRGSSGSGGGLCAKLEKPKFVPMARPYASDILIFTYVHILTYVCLFVGSFLHMSAPASQGLPKFFPPPSQIGAMNGRAANMHRSGVSADDGKGKGNGAAMSAAKGVVGRPARTEDFPTNLGLC